MMKLEFFPLPPNIFIIIIRVDFNLGIGLTVGAGNPTRPLSDGLVGQPGNFIIPHCIAIAHKMAFNGGRCIIFWRHEAHHARQGPVFVRPLVRSICDWRIIFNGIDTSSLGGKYWPINQTTRTTEIKIQKKIWKFF